MAMASVKQSPSLLVKVEQIGDLSLCTPSCEAGTSMQSLHTCRRTRKPSSSDSTTCNLRYSCSLVPSSYVHALECYVSAKQEFLSTSTSGQPPAPGSLATLYAYQRKYVNALLKQLPPGTAWPGTARLVLMHPPSTIKNPRTRQGPFLLQPAPRNLEGSEGGDATDIVYMSFGDDAAEESEGETERLGLVLVAFQDGKVDVYLDVEKVEARWENKQVGSPALHRDYLWSNYLY